MPQDTDRLDRFHAVLVEEIRAHRPDLLSEPFTVAEIYQELVPYRTHRDRLAVDMNGDYEHLLVRLLSGEGDYLVLEADAARQELQAELESRNPNTGLFREYAAADVRLNPVRLDAGTAADPAGGNADASGGAEVSDEAVAVETLAPSPDADAPRAEETGEEPPAPHLFDDAGPTPARTPATAPEPGDGPAGAAAGRGVGDGGEDDGPCAWCRATLPDRENLKYCPFCGTDVHVVPCPSCGEALEPDWRFCIACGAGVTSG